MSKNYKNHNKKSNRKSYKKRKNTRKHSVGMTIITVLLVAALLGGAATLLRRDNTNNDEEFKTVYFLPNDNWLSDESVIGAYVWKGLTNEFVVGTDMNEDNVFEFKVDNEFESIIFVDLKPDTNNLGLDWVNVREQTSNLVVPKDKNVYYHQYANEWSASAEKLFAPTTEEVNVYLDCEDNWEVLQTPVMYCFDKTGVMEQAFFVMTQCGAHQYTATVPAGYTHIVFIDYTEEGVSGTWDNISNQTSDLIIPVGEAIYFNTATNNWELPATE